jgi:5-methylcytosine-specific restriction endonuclease McrA
MTNKRCTKCGETKPLGEFYRNKKTDDGYTVWCRSCVGISTRQYKATHPEKIQESNRLYAIEHSDSAHARFAKYYAEHRAEKMEKVRLWDAAHPGRNATRVRKYNEAHPEKRRENRRNRRALVHGAIGKHTAEEWMALKERYHFTCLRCGRKEPEIKLTADHVIPLKLGGTNEISNIQPLCHSCNCTKHTKHVDYRQDTAHAD